MIKNNLSSNDLIWSGEHWINYLRPPGKEDDSARISLYHAAYSPAGEGTMAFVDIAGFAGICTNNHGFAQFIIETMGTSVFKADMALMDAAFSRLGDIRNDPGWTIETSNDKITAIWQQLNPPYIGPPTINPHIIFTILTFAQMGSIALNGEFLPGNPYPRDAWTKNLGTPHSSCCFALAETMIRARED